MVGEPAVKHIPMPSERALQILIAVGQRLERIRGFLRMASSYGRVEDRCSIPGRGISTHESASEGKFELNHHSRTYQSQAREPQ